MDKYDQQDKWIAEMPGGTLLAQIHEDGSHSKYVRVIDDKRKHLEGFVLELSTGKLMHLTHIIDSATIVDCPDPKFPKQWIFVGHKWVTDNDDSTWILRKTEESLVEHGACPDCPGWDYVRTVDQRLAWDSEKKNFIENCPKNATCPVRIGLEKSTERSRRVIERMYPVPDRDNDE